MVRRLQCALPSLPGWGPAIAPEGFRTERARTLRLTEGGLLAATTVVLGWLSGFVPYLNLVLPAPTAVLIYRHGILAGLMSWGVAVALVGLLMGNLPGAVLLSLAGLIAVGIGEPLRRRLAPGQVLALGVLGALVWLAGMLAGGLWLLGINGVEETFRAMEQSVRQALEIYGRMGMPQEQLRMTRESLEATLALMRRLAPALFFLTALATAYANYWVVRVVLNRLGEKLPWFAPFSRWRSSPLPALAIGLGLALGAFGQRVALLAALSGNLFLLGWVSAAVQGLSLVWFWLDQQQAGRALRVLAVVLVMTFWPAMALAAAAGALDPWFNWRRL